MATPNGTGAPAQQLDATTAQQMAAVLGPDVASFEELIKALMSTQNEVRDQAEKVFNACKEHQVSLERS